MLSNYASKPFRKLASSQTLLLCLLELQLIWCKIMETWCNQELIRLQTLYLTRMTHVIFSSVFCELGTSTCKSNSQLYKARLHKRLICDTGNGEQINLKIITGTKSENLSKCFLRVWQLSLFLINVNSVSYSWQKKIITNLALHQMSLWRWNIHSFKIFWILKKPTKQNTKSAWPRSFSVQTRLIQDQK